MGYDISLIGEDGESVQVARFSEGGVQPVGGSTTADISITYNYSKILHDNLDMQFGIRWLYGKKYAECVDRLESAIKVLGTDQDDDYWAATNGNVGHILEILLKWVTQYPEAHFEGD